MKNLNLKRILLMVLTVMLVGLTVFSLVACNKKKDDNNNKSNLSSMTIFDKDENVLYKIDGVKDTQVDYEPIRDGYKFGGYYLDKELTQETTLPKNLTENNQVIYTAWNPITYTIRFDGGRGQGQMNDIVVKYGEKVTLPENTFTFRGARFEEWLYIAEDESSKSFANNSVVSNLTTTDNAIVILTAIFDTYDADNFVVEDGVVKAYYGNAQNVSLPQTASVVSADIFKNNPDAAKITKLEVPSHYVQIEQGAFAPLTKLVQLRVPFIGGTEDSNRFLAYVFGAQKYTDNDYSFQAEIQYNSLVAINEDFSKLLIPQTLKKVVVTNPIYTIESGAFYKAYSLEKVVIFDYEELSVIGESAFEGCINLGYDSELDIINPLNFMENVEYIGAKAFSAYISESNASGGSYIFTRLFNVAPLKEVVTIGDNAFYGCVYLNDLTFGEHLRTVGSYAFLNCVSLESLVFPNTIQKIGDYAFVSCASLTSVTIGSGITDIGQYAFAECEALAEINMLGSAPKVSANSFCHELVEQDNGYKPVINDGAFAIYVNTNLLNSYKSSWSTYAKYLNTKGATEIFYWGANNDGSYATKFEVRGGSMVYITDTNLEFLDLIDWFSDFYNTFRADLVGESYSMSIVEIDLEANQRVGNERFFEISHPQIVDALGQTDTFLIRVRPERVQIDGTTYYVPTVEWISKYFGAIGTSEESLLKIDRDELGHYVLYSRPNTDTDYVATMPEGAVYGEYRLYYILAYTQKMVGMDWYNAKGELIKSDKYLVANECLYNVPDEDGQEICFTDYPTQILLDGNGQALLSVYQNGNNVEYIGSYAFENGQEYGNASVKINLLNLAGMGELYSGTLTLDGYFDGAYHRGVLKVSSDKNFIDKTMYTSAGVSDSYICYSQDDSEYYMFYEYKSNDGSVTCNYVEYGNNTMTLHGDYAVVDKQITITLPNSLPIVGVIDDARGSFHVDGILGRVDKYTAYNSWEDSTFYMSEDFLGITLIYYYVKMDGKGGAIFHDEHDDDYDNYYIGTYVNTGEHIGGDANGTYDIYYFEGVECTEDGRVISGGRSYACYYVLHSYVDGYDDGDDGIVYEGTILSVTETLDTKNFVVYDESGLKFADLSVSPFGIATLVIYDTKVVNGQEVSTVNEELTANVSAVAYQTGAGQLVYVVVNDLAGNYMFRISINEYEEWEYEFEGPINPQPPVESSKIYPDVDFLSVAD